MKTSTHISAGIARIVKTGLLLSLVFAINNALGQISCGCTIEHNSASSAAQNYTLSSTDVLCIKSGNWTGSLTASSGATLCVEAGATAAPASISGWADISNSGKLSLPAITSGPGQSIENKGELYFSGNITFNNAIDIVNNEEGKMYFTQLTNLANSSTLTNNDSVFCAMNFSSAAGTEIINEGFIIFASDFSPNGTVTNNGFLESNTSITINTSAGLTNNCSAISNMGFYNTNTNTVNNGNIIITGSSGTFQNNAGTISTGLESTIKGVNFTNNASITGSGQFYFSGTTSNTGTFSATSGTIDFYDTGMPASGFDVQSGILNGSFSYSEINEPLQTDISSGCSQFVKDAVSGGLTVELSVVSSTIAEGTSTAIIATASQVPTSDIQINLWAGGTASSSDYNLTSTVITIPAGNTTASILLSAVDDNIAEPGDPETVSIEISSITNAAKGSATKVDISIADNEAIPLVSLSKNIGNIGEKGSVILTASLDHPTTEDVFVTLAMSGTATNAEDYTVSIVVPAGQLTGSTVLTAIDDDTYELGLAKVLVVDIDQVFNAIENGEQQETIVITDDDGIPRVDIAYDRIEVGEGGSAILFVKLSNPSVQDITTTLAFSGTAVENTDYTVEKKTVLIPAGDTLALVEIYTIDDEVFETTTNETVVADVSYVVNGFEEGVQKETLEIVDDESNIIASLSANKTVIAENESVKFTATLSSASIENVIIDFTFSGSATIGSDYTATTAQISIPAGSTEASFTISAIDDNIYEPGGNETVIVDIDAVTNGVEDGNQQATVEIADNDTKPSIILTAEQSSIVEGSSTMITATVSNPSTQIITVRLGFSGSATITDDFTISSENIIIPAGANSSYISLTAVDDNLYETEINDTLVVDVISVTNGDEVSVQQEKIEIVDNESQPSVSISIDKTSITETGSVVLTATLDKPSVENVTVGFQFTGSATKDSDYKLSAETIQIIGGNTSGSIIINAIDDNEYEPTPDETVVINIDQVTNGTENGTQQKTFVIVDNDELPTVSLSAEQTSIFEGSSTNITASLSNPASTPVTVTLVFSGTAVKTVDYTMAAELITIPAGSTEASAALTAIEDLVYEGTTNEVATVTIENVSNATKQGNQSADVEILDKDRRPVITMSSATSSVTEGAAATINFKMDKASIENVQIELAFSGTATYTTDYMVNPTSVSIPAGNTEASITLTAIDDKLYEPLPDETAIVDITNIVNGSEDGIQQVKINIVENDDQPTVSFAIDKAKINEGDSAYATITLSHLSTQTVTASLVFSGPASTSDYSIEAESISVLPEQSSASIKLYATKDKLYEPTDNDSLIINISTVTNGFEDGVQKDAIKIVDTDSEPLVSISYNKASVSENGTAELTAQLTNASTQQITVELAYSGTATINTDYTAESSITIVSGTFSGTATVSGIDDDLYEAGNETVIAEISSVTNGFENGTQKDTLELVDNESTVTVSISANAAEIEEGQSTTITASLNKTSVQDVAVTFSSSGTAEIGADYNLSALTVTIPAGNTSASVTLTATNDLYYEPLGNETATINIESVINGVENGTQQAFVDIIDKDVMPSVTISADPTSITEGSSTNIIATLSHLTTQTVSAGLTFSGSAIKTTDYLLSNETITIAGGQKTASVSLTAIDDELYEAGINESVIIDIATLVNATENGTQQATVEIVENDNEPFVSLAANKTSINEDGSLLMTATLSHKSTAEVSMTFVYSGTAQKDVDYQLSSETITILAGTNSSSVTISGIDDDEYEPGADETVNIGINKVSGGSENGSQQVEFNIIDNDFVPSLSIALNQSSITEGNATTLTAKLSNPVDKAVTVSYGFNGTAVNLKDYSVTAESVTIPAGSLEASITITALADGLYEPGIDEIVNIEVLTVTNATEDGAQTASLAIIDANSQPRVTISAGSSIISESGSTTINLLLSNLSTEDATIEIASSGSATIDKDYILNKTSLFIPAGSSTASAELAAIDDNLYEGLPNETVSVNIVSAINASESGIQQVTVEIEDNEPKPAITIALNKASVIEADSAILTATTDRVSTVPVTAYFAFEGTVEAVDYQVSASRITIPAGETSGSLTIYALDDKVYEPLANDSLFISIASLVNATDENNQLVKLAILDKNEQPQVTLSVDKQSVSESGNVNVIATLDGLSDENIIIELGFTGTATKGEDYNPASESITIIAGQQTASVNIAIIDDALYEAGDNETIVIDIAAVSNGLENGVQQKTVEIIDNESNLTVSLSADKSQVTEGESLTLTVRLNNVATQDVDVELSYSGTATKGVDYSAPISSVTIPAGSVTAVVSVSVIDDAVYESITAETIVIDIASVNNAIENGVQKQTVEIIDNDAAPSATLTADKTSIAEDGTVNFTVTLSNPAFENVSIALGLGGTATNGIDYTISALSMNIAAGATTATVSITAIDDDLYETDINETVSVSIASISNATENGEQIQYVEIVDNDPIPVLSLSVDKTTIAESESAVLTATISGKSALPVEINLAFSGTATKSSDYLPSAETMVIASAQLKSSIIIQALDDDEFEPGAAEIIEIGIASLSNAVEDGVQQKNISITDNDVKPTVSISLNQTSVQEGNTVQLTATLSNPVSSDVTVALAFAGTATKSVDYEVQTESITIPKGTAQASISIITTDDNLYETTIDETVIINVSAVSNADENGEQTATLSIVENDAQPKVSIAISPTEISEGASGVISLTLSNPSVEEVTTSIEFSGSATITTDYTVTGQSIVFPPNSVTQSVQVKTIDDNLFEPLPNETIIVDIASTTNATEDGVQQATAQIVDNDAQPSINFAFSTENIEEGAQATLTANISHLSTKDVVVEFAFSGTAESTDYTLSSSLITIPAGSLNGSLSLTANEDNLYEPGANESVIAAINAISGAHSPTDQTAQLNLIDTDAKPLVELQFGSATVTEGSSEAYTLTMNKRATVDVKVSLSFYGTAEKMNDYTVSADTLIIAAGSMSSTGTITAIDDNLYETEIPDTVIADIIAVTNADESIVGADTITITENDAMPTLSMTINKETISESGTATVSFTLDHPSVENITAELTLSGTATFGSDYSISAESINIAAGATSATVEINAIDDNELEAGENETVIVDIATVNNATENGAQQVQTAIIDNESNITLALSFNADVLVEGQTGTLTAILNRATDKDVTLSLSFAGTASIGDDYTFSASSMAIPAGATTASIDIEIIDDIIYEPGENETILISIAELSNAIEDGDQLISIEIADNDSDLEISLAADTYLITEGEMATITATSSSTSDHDITIVLATNGTAAINKDFSLVKDTIIIKAGELTGTAILSATDDNIYETAVNEIAIIDVVKVEYAQELGEQSLSISIADNESLPEVWISANQSQLLEGDTAKLTASLIHPSVQDITVDVAFAGAAQLGLDYEFSTNSVTIPAGSLSKSLSINALKDSIYEPGGNEVISIAISSVVNANEKGEQKAAIEIIDSDSIPSISISSAKEIINEGESTLLLFEINGKVSTAVTAELVISGTALKGVDYEMAKQSVTIPAGTQFAELSFSSIDNAAYYPENRYVIATFGTITNAKEAAAQSARIEIMENDNFPVLTMALAKKVITETGGTSLNFTLDHAINHDVKASIKTGGTATLGQDYSLSADTVLIKAGNTAGTISIDGIDDAAFEGEQGEKVIINLVSVENAIEPDIKTDSLIIIDDDQLPSVSLSANLDQVTEGESFALIATLNRISSQPVEVKLSFAGTAAADDDFTVNNTTIIVPAGSMSASIAVSVVDDDIYESGAFEKIIASIALVKAGAEQGEQELVVEIIDNDPMPVTRISFSPKKTDEGATLYLNAVNDRLSTMPVTVNISFSGTADEGVDYIPEAWAVTVPALTYSSRLAVKIVDDILYETDINETISASISSITGGLASPDTAYSEIEDNERIPEVIVTTLPDQVTEGESAQILYKLTHPSVETISGTIAVTGEATEGNDYDISSLSFEFAPLVRELATTINTIDDDEYENDESILINIKSVENGEIQQGAAKIEIIDGDERPVPSVRFAESSIYEGEMSSVILSFDKTSVLPTILNIAFSGTAIDGTDYVKPVPLQEEMIVIDSIRTIIYPIETIDNDYYTGGSLSVTVKVSTYDNDASSTAELLIIDDEIEPLDTDGDGVYDDGNGPLGKADIDDDNDGIRDEFEQGDSDNDGTPDRIDLDSDNDGISDLFEAFATPSTTLEQLRAIDTDNDDMIDDFKLLGLLAADANRDGFADKLVNNPFPKQDLDGDGKQNFRDTDSDGDSKPDAAEGLGDCDFDYILNWIDMYDQCGSYPIQVFSPNDDGINDFFMVGNVQAYPDNKLQIFNRWGNLVYETEGYENNWDGTYSGDNSFGSGDLPIGTYFFMFDPGNGDDMQTGYVYITR